MYISSITSSCYHMKQMLFDQKNLPFHRDSSHEPEDDYRIKVVRLDNALKFLK